MRAAVTLTADRQSHDIGECGRHGDFACLLTVVGTRLDSGARSSTPKKVRTATGSENERIENVQWTPSPPVRRHSTGRRLGRRSRAAARA